MSSYIKEGGIGFEGMFLVVLTIVLELLLRMTLSLHVRQEIVITENFISSQIMDHTHKTLFSLIP